MENTGNIGNNEKMVFSSSVVIGDDDNNTGNVQVKTSIQVALSLSDEQSYECLKSVIASYAEYRRKLAERRGETFDIHKFVNSLVIDLQLLQ